ncbi:Sporulation initiation inhibitor protein Soj [Rosistilla ulvae]|uniref:Sporulation initiation inhibitor protein Soj n=1 Tax=Rosistilla ulvae TaxID=1930277 RepID=A0A517M2M8_9BACT|nr:AAA family ATPase [Rosistilla ulvae]QDS89109.1 Sporulation initiation inhibitor protein Soj [Rosistilla ulvae]
MTSPRILVHRTESSLDEELRNAMASAPNVHPVFHFQSDLRGTIGAAKDLQPSIVILEIGEDFETLKTLVEESIAAAPDATIVGVYDVQRLPASSTESSMMMRALRLGVEDFLRRPVAGSDFRQVLQRRLAPRRKSHRADGKLISFISNKGGVGKSTAAVNVAVTLAMRYPDRVALIDSSLQMGVCATQLDLSPDTTLVDAWQQRDRLDESLLAQLMTVHESGLHLLAAPENAIEASEIDDSFLSRILLMARRSYDFVIIDTFPLFDRTVMAVLDLCDQAVIVVENVVPTLQTVRGFFSLLDEVEFPQHRQRVLLNRYSTRAGGPRASDVGRYLGRNPDYVIPHDQRVILAANTGRPFVLNATRWNKAAAAIRTLADDLEAFAVAPAGGLPLATVAAPQQAGGDLIDSVALEDRLGGELR